MHISFSWCLASMDSQKDCCGFSISLFTASMKLAVHPRLTSPLLLCLCQDQRMAGMSPGSKTGKVGTGAKRWTALLYLEKVNWKKVLLLDCNLTSVVTVRSLIHGK